MRVFFGVLFMAAFSAVAAAGDLTGIEQLKGSDWIKMEQAKKELVVYSALGGLQRQGVLPQNKPYFYIKSLDKLLEIDPDMQGEPLENIFVFCVYEHEPALRGAIDRLRVQRQE